MSRPSITAAGYQPKNATEFVPDLVARLTGNRAETSGH
jgi:hypothetical protein